MNILRQLSLERTTPPVPCLQLWITIDHGLFDIGSIDAFGILRRFTLDHRQLMILSAQANREYKLLEINHLPEGVHNAR